MGTITLNGREVRGSEMESLVELSTICSMCNDSSVDYNEVGAALNVMLLRRIHGDALNDMVLRIGAALNVMILR